MEVEVEAESRIHELQLRVEELEKLREADNAELTALRESEQSAASELERVKEENNKLTEENKEAKESSKNAQQAKERTELEKRELLDALARSDSDKQQLESERDHGID
jgi:chromosome segregation ATPase